MSSLIATIHRDKAGVDEGNKSVCDGRTTACNGSVQTVSGQPTMLSRMQQAWRPDIAVIPARRGPPALSLPYLNAAVLPAMTRLGNVIRLT